MKKVDLVRYDHYWDRAADTSSSRGEGMRKDGVCGAIRMERGVGRRWVWSWCERG